jgi:hypothetical protein
MTTPPKLPESVMKRIEREAKEYSIVENGESFDANPQRIASRIDFMEGATREAERAQKLVEAAKLVNQNYYCDSFSSEAMEKLNEALEAYLKDEV